MAGSGLYADMGIVAALMEEPLERRRGALQP
jgi:hypothetical protein